MEAEHPVVLAVLGPPGSGKSMLSRLLGERYLPGLRVFRFGDEWRRQASVDRRLAGMAQGSLDHLGWLDEEAAARVMRRAFLDPGRFVLNRGAPILLEGFPGTAVQAGALIDLALRSGVDLGRVRALELELDRETAWQRVQSRRVSDL